MAVANGDGPKPSALDVGTPPVALGGEVRADGLTASPGAGLPRPAPPGLAAGGDALPHLPAKRSLGQHFLLDPGICARIAALAGPLDRRHVLEVGPGPGGLTRALLATSAVSVTAIELDRRAVAALAPLQAAHPGRLQLIEGDALRLDAPALLPGPRVAVANLPYNVATPLLVGWLRNAAAWEKLTLMFQQEVAERIAALPATEAYGRLGVLAQWRCRCDLLLRLPPGAFTPPPKVWSAVVGLVPHPTAPAPALFATMERLTAAAFGQRRKMLRAALRPLGDPMPLLDAAGIAGERRAETLSVGEFDTLARALLARGLPAQGLLAGDG